MLNRKRDENGDFSRYKARLVVCGNHQQREVDYDATYALVVSYSTVRCILATSIGCYIDQGDASTAFLGADGIEHGIYMVIPQEVLSDKALCKRLGVKEDQVFKILKSLYGLKQSPLIYYTTVVKLGFKRSDIRFTNLLIYFPYKPCHNLLQFPCHLTSLLCGAGKDSKRVFICLQSTSSNPRKFSILPFISSINPPTKPP